MSKKIILRADGNQQIGLGHVYRLLALAEMLREKNYIIFAIRDPEPFLAALIRNTCHELQVLPSFDYTLPDKRLVSEEMPFDLADVLTGDEIVITDGYWFGINYQHSVKAAGCKLICVDDLADSKFVADGIINHAPGIDPAFYKVTPHTRLFLGLNYLLLRPIFFRATLSKDNEVPNVLISLGGSDSFELTKTILLNCLKASERTIFQVLYASSFTQSTKDFLFKFAASSPERIFLHHNLNAGSLVNLIDTCTHAVVSSSTIALECVARGLIPTVGYYTKNQHYLYSGLIKEKLAYGIGDFLQPIDEEGLKQLNSYFLSDAKEKRTINSISHLRHAIENI